MVLYLKKAYSLRLLSSTVLRYHWWTKNNPIMYSIFIHWWEAFLKLCSIYSTKSLLTYELTKYLLKIDNFFRTTVSAAIRLGSEMCLVKAEIS